MARPTKLTADLAGKVCLAIRAGNTFKAAAASVGIGESTFHRWMERGRLARSGIHRDFHDAVKVAEAKSEVHAVAIVRQAMAEEPANARWLLTHRHGWSKAGFGEMPASAQRPAIDLASLSEKELKLLEKINARAAKH